MEFASLMVLGMLLSAPIVGHLYAKAVAERKGLRRKPVCNAGEFQVL